MSILGLLGVCFIVLKLTHYIDWSWWWVTAPFWGGIALWAFFTLLAIVAMFFGWAFSAKDYLGKSIVYRFKRR